jgi:hypothetical protein
VYGCGNLAGRGWQLRRTVAEPKSGSSTAEPLKPESTKPPDGQAAMAYVLVLKIPTSARAAEVVAITKSAEMATEMAEMAAEMAAVRGVGVGHRQPCRGRCPK